MEVKRKESVLSFHCGFEESGSGHQVVLQELLYTRSSHWYVKGGGGSWEGLRGFSPVKSSCGSCRGPGFGFEYPHGGSKPPLTHSSSRGSSILCFLFFWPNVRIRHASDMYTYIQQNTHTQKIKFSNLNMFLMCRPF